MPLPLREVSPRNDQFGEPYWREIFTVWYSNGKPTANTLVDMIPVHPIFNIRPSKSALRNRIFGDFTEWSAELDKDVIQHLNTTLVAEKIAMLDRHAKVSQKMQKMGMDYLDANGVGGARNAIQLVIEGLRIERESIGAPKIAQKVMDMDDKQLLDELRMLVEGSPVISIEPNDTDNGQEI